MRKPLTILSLLGLSFFGKSQTQPDLSKGTIDFSIGTRKPPIVDTFKVAILCSEKDSSSTFVINGFVVKKDWLYSLNGEPSFSLVYLDERKKPLRENIIVWLYSKQK